MISKFWPKNLTISEYLGLILPNSEVLVISEFQPKNLMISNFCV